MTTSRPHPATARTYAAAVIGIEGHLTQAQAAAANGPPGLRITGLPDSTIRETRDRVNAAVLNSGQTWPARTITVSVLPASLPKRGTGFGLAIAVAALTTAGAVPASASDKCLFYSELGLDGSLRPVRGVVPALLAAARAGCTRAAVAAYNSAEAVVVPASPWSAVNPCGQSSPGCVATVSRAVRHSCREHRVAALRRLARSQLGQPGYPAAFAAGAGGQRGRRPPPVLNRPPRCPHPCPGRRRRRPHARAHPHEAMEVTAIHSTAGPLASGHALITRPPLRTLHHTTTPAAMLGGGPGITRPGEAALAHRGVLFLDDAPEFARNVLQALRQPLQHREVTVSRSGSIVRFPAKFTLVAGMSPCPCGAQPDCTCSPLQTRRYRARLTGELGSYIAIWLNAASIDPPRRPAETMTRTPFPPHGSPPPATAPATGSAAPPGTSTPTSPVPNCAAPTCRQPKPSPPSTAQSTLARSAHERHTRSSGSPGPWPTWQATPGSARPTVPRRSPFI
jgi:magnesium chelatase family protein